VEGYLPGSGGSHGCAAIVYVALRSGSERGGSSGYMFRFGDPGGLNLVVFLRSDGKSLLLSLAITFREGHYCGLASVASLQRRGRMSKVVDKDL